MWKMIGAIWNVRGLNKKGRLQCITDFVNENKLDFVGFQEIKKESFEDSFLSYIHRDFAWQFFPAIGTTGGILVGFNNKKFDILAHQLKTYAISVMIKNCVDNFIWRFICVYGSAYEEGKMEFIEELEGMLENWSGPTVLGGDFNLVTNIKEKIMVLLIRSGLMFSKIG